MRELTPLQRLLRERHLQRYLLAVERVDLVTIEAIWQRAARDAILERMLLEAHEMYLEAAADSVQEESFMESEKDLHQANLNSGTLPETEPAPGPVSPRKRSKYARPLQVIAAVLLVCLVVSGLLVVRNLHPAPTATHMAPPKWCTVPGERDVKNAGDPVFTGFANISANDVWAIGYLARYTAGPYTPLVEHWDGTRWSVVPTPDLGSLLNDRNFADISAVSANDVWLVGEAFHYINTSSEDHLRPLVEHWDGSRWSIVNLPADFPLTAFSAVVARAANDVWLAGENTSLIAHWDGSHWSEIRLPAALDQIALTSLTVLAPSNLWIAGGFTDSADSPTTPLIAHWDGQQWTQITGLVNGNALFRQIVAHSANDIWAAGETFSGSFYSPSATGALLAHWDGTRWSVVKNIISGDAILTSVLPLAAQDIWVAGGTGRGQYAYALVAHWDGQRWSTALPKSPPFGFSYGLTSVEGKIWVASEIIDHETLSVAGALLEMC